MEQKQFFLNDDWLKRVLNLNKILHSMKYYISESRLEILIKKKNDDPIPNKINYIVILNDVKEFWEKNDAKKKEEQHTIQKNNS